MCSPSSAVLAAGVPSSLFILLSMVALTHIPTFDVCLEFPDDSVLLQTALALSPPPPAGHPHAFDPSVQRGFRLLRVQPLHVGGGRGVDAFSDDAASAPVLFVHGHRGGPNQANALSTLAEAARAAWPAGGGAGPARLAVYALDFAAASSAFHAGLLRAQASCINDALAALLARHPGFGSVVVVGHSMGGVAARLAYLLPNHVPGSAAALITLNSPHQVRGGGRREWHRNGERGAARREGCTMGQVAAPDEGT